ncbi:unnamed protein product [Ranitomeya imitator]|uniref:ribonuclease H n=1 Tax=Ranitomeya imitator TaxID=111125 RepID=A0ABN9LUT7_9NEOB|nr:unnamed protein product [Ranitomeya imitator]
MLKWGSPDVGLGVSDKPPWFVARSWDQLPTYLDSLSREKDKGRSGPYIPDSCGLAKKGPVNMFMDVPWKLPGCPDSLSLFNSMAVEAIVLERLDFSHLIIQAIIGAKKPSILVYLLQILKSLLLVEYGLGLVPMSFSLSFSVFFKIGLQFPHRFWDSKIHEADFFGHIPPDSSKRGLFGVFYDMDPQGKHAVLMSVITGDSVNIIKGMDDKQVVKQCMVVLKELFKEQDVPSPVKYFVTRWSKDPWAQMAYSFVKTGGSGEAYDILAEDIQGKIFFAGEVYTICCLKTTPLFSQCSEALRHTEEWCVFDNCCFKPASMQQQLYPVYKSPKQGIRKVYVKYSIFSCKVSSERESECESDGSLDPDSPYFQKTVYSLIEAVNQTLKVEEDSGTALDQTVSFIRTKRSHRAFASHPEFRAIVNRPDKRFTGPLEAKYPFSADLKKDWAESPVVDPPVSRLASKTILSVPDGSSIKTPTDRQKQNLARSVFEASEARAKAFSWAINALCLDCVIVCVPESERFQDFYSNLFVVLKKDGNNFLRLTIRDQHFQFTALPFGLTTAPRVFTKVMAAVMSVLHSRGMIALPYLDDLLIKGPSLHDCSEFVRITCDTLSHLGWLINLSKSSPVPAQQISFLGMTLDSSRWLGRKSSPHSGPSQSFEKVRSEDGVLQKDRCSVHSSGRSEEGFCRFKGHDSQVDSFHYPGVIPSQKLGLFNSEQIGTDPGSETPTDRSKRCLKITREHHENK